MDFDHCGIVQVQAIIHNVHGNVPGCIQRIFTQLRTVIQSSFTSRNSLVAPNGTSFERESQLIASAGGRGLCDLVFASWLHKIVDGPWSCKRIQKIHENPWSVMIFEQHETIPSTQVGLSSSSQTEVITDQTGSLGPGGLGLGLTPKSLIGMIPVGATRSKWRNQHLQDYMLHTNIRA